MMTPTTELEGLERDELVRVAFDHMLSGMIVTRAFMPLVVLRGGDLDLMNQMAIDEWMGASPVYTHRMRRLMGIEGDDVQAIMKALQLDVGFVHQYMDVVYEVLDDLNAEFWLAHCGALIDVEPFGEERVFGMCHTIEDPTFDATALATNPKARIRPIHRPPRTPEDRHPHCHWTIKIDESNDPIGPMDLTDRVSALPLASVPNERRNSDGPGRHDYTGPFDPSFQLADLSSPAMAAVAREFQVQSHLLMASSDLALRDHFPAPDVADLMAEAWLGAGWIASERMAKALRLETVDADGLARVLALQPMIPPGFDRTITVDGDAVRLELTAKVDGLLAGDHPGWCGTLAKGDTRGLVGMARGFDRGARVDRLLTDGDRAVVEITVGAEADPGDEPDIVALSRVGSAPNWDFDLADPVAVTLRSS